MSQLIIIDGVEYNVALTELKRKANILDKYANRSEDGVLHREVIGTYYNYTLKIHCTNMQVYNTIFEVLSEPVPSHLVELPHDHTSFEGYFSSIEDEIHRIDVDGETIYKGLTCRLTAMKPRKVA